MRRTIARARVLSLVLASAGAWAVAIPLRAQQPDAAPADAVPEGYVKTRLSQAGNGSQNESNGFPRPDAVSSSCSVKGMK